jgi:hypothetical protein
MPYVAQLAVLIGPDVTAEVAASLAGAYHLEKRWLLVLLARAEIIIYINKQQAKITLHSEIQSGVHIEQRHAKDFGRVYACVLVYSLSCSSIMCTLEKTGLQSLLHSLQDRNSHCLR